MTIAAITNHNRHRIAIAAIVALYRHCINGHCDLVCETTDHRWKLFGVSRLAEVTIAIAIVVAHSDCHRQCIPPMDRLGSIERSVGRRKGGERGGGRDATH